MIALTVFFLFQLGIVKSFLITKSEFPPFGFVHLLTYMGLELSLMSFFSLVALPNLRIRIKILRSKEILLFIAVFATGIGIYGLYFGALKNFPLGPLNPRFWILAMSNNFRGNIVWGAGYTMMSNMSIVALAISALKSSDSKVYSALIWLNFAVLCLSAFAYSARLKIVLAVLLVFVPYIRLHKFGAKPRMPLILLLLTVLIVFLIWGGGIRGSSNIAKHWTDSSFQWSVYIFTDYFVSTTLFSVVGLSESPENASDLWSIRAKLGPSEIHGYTNSGRYTSIYSRFGLFGFAFVFVRSLFIMFVWKSFVKGFPIGLILYPMVVYFLIEGLRIEALLVPDFYVPLGVLLLIALFFGDEFVYKDI